MYVIPSEEVVWLSKTAINTTPVSQDDPQLTGYNVETNIFVQERFSFRMTSKILRRNLTLFYVYYSMSSSLFQIPPQVDLTVAVRIVFHVPMNCFVGLQQDIGPA